MMPGEGGILRGSCSTGFIDRDDAQEKDVLEKRIISVPWS